MNLTDIRVGDLVKYGPVGARKIGPVQSVSPKQFYVGGIRYWKENGRRVDEGCVQDRATRSVDPKECS